MPEKYNQMVLTPKQVKRRWQQRNKEFISWKWRRLYDLHYFVQGVSNIFLNFNSLESTPLLKDLSDASVDV